MKRSLGFRAWVYFRFGWSTYFAFIFAATNTIVITYYLAIENIQLIKEIFPTFELYAAFFGLIMIPLLVGIGYFHFKRSQGYKTEADIRLESNPHTKRLLVNTELILETIFRLNDLFLKKLNNKKLTEKEFDEIYLIQEKIQEYKQHRTVTEIILTDIDKINLNG